MKEFVTAVQDVEHEDGREERILALMEKEGVSREEAEVIDSRGMPVEFKLDGRAMKAYPLADGQLAFMMAALGRGQSSDQRFAAIINIMLESLEGDDRDYLEGRLLSGDPKKRLPIKQIEEIFEYLVEEWFARPTQS